MVLEKEEYSEKFGNRYAANWVNPIYFESDKNSYFVGCADAGSASINTMRFVPQHILPIYGFQYGCGLKAHFINDEELKIHLVRLTN